MRRSSWYLVGCVALVVGAVVAVALPVGGSPLGSPYGFGPPDPPPGGRCPDPPIAGSPPESWEVSYGLGWDSGLVEPITPAAARGRDAAGDPYVAVLHDGAGPGVVIRTAWSARRLELLALDDEGRSRVRLDLRAIDDGLVLREHEEWSPSDQVARRVITYGPDGTCWDDAERADGGSLQQVGRAVRPAMGRPEPGRWDDVLDLVGLAAPVVPTGRHDPGVRVVDGAPWTPPGPLAPGDIDRMFDTGARVRTSAGEATIRVHEAGRVKVPSGRLVVMDPTYLPDAAAELTVEVPVPPGTHPVTLAVARHDTGETVVGARLTVGQEPAVTWDMARREGQELVELGDGEYYDFGVDSGTASFADAAAVDSLADAAVDAAAARLDLSASVGDDDMILFPSGDGDGGYPVWVGRDADGGVVAVVADMLVLEGPDEFTAGP